MRVATGVVLALLALGATGCGSGADMGEVSGKVTIDGQPVEGVRITFEPQFAGGSASIGETDAQGNYTARFSATRTGVMLGKHNVRIRAVRYDDTGEGQDEVLAKIPPEYDQETEQQFEVQPGKNTYDLDVKTR